MTDRPRALPLSVNVSLPAECEELIQQRVAAAEARGQVEVWTTVIHDALWQMRNREKSREELRQEIEQAMLDGINSGPAIPVTPAFCRNMRARARRRHKEIEAARARGLVGNLLLPQELFAFVQDQVVADRFNSPTEVVCEALQSITPAVCVTTTVNRQARGSRSRRKRSDR
ncbi:MAG: type II toxin-antitoxin system ParD family antitoxin [Candidatus Binatia bacterium]